MRVISALCVFASALIGCNGAGTDDTRAGTVSERSSFVTAAGSAALNIDIVDPPAPSLLSDAGVMPSSYVEPPMPAPAVPHYNDDAVGTLLRSSAGCSGVGRVRFSNPTARAISHFPDIVTDYQVDSIEVLSGTVPSTITRLGGTLNGVSVDVSDQPKYPLNQELFVIFFDDQHGKYASLVAPTVGTDRVLISGEEMLIASALTVIAQQQVTQ